MHPMGGAQPMSNPFGAAAGAPRSNPFGGPPATSPFGAPPTGNPVSDFPPAAMTAARSSVTSGVDTYGAPPTMGATYGGPVGGGVEPPGPFQAAAKTFPSGHSPTVPGVAAHAPGQDHNTLLNDCEMFNAPWQFMRCTVGRLPSSTSTRQRANIPLGIVLQPLAPVAIGMEDVQSVNHGAVGSIVRCSKCRTYINPFVIWVDNGRRWTCNLCGANQATSDSYYHGLDETGKRADRWQRPELCRGVVEYIAPGEYMVRPPQPPVFMFVIDVSYNAVATGMLDTVVSSIKESIQSGLIPGGQRAQAGIITYDTSVHFYNLSPNLSQPQMMVVSDLDDLFLPLPDDILVPLHESESSILTLLEALPTMFQDTRASENCMGSAVKGAYMAMKHIGGKMLVFGSCIPSVGEHALRSTRDNPRLLGTDREVELLRPVSDSYKDLGAELTRAQISVEMFLAPQQFIDLASISPLAKYTGGDVRYYPQFHIHSAGLKLKHELTHVLTRYMGWEAVMRVRVSRGWKITKFYGHLFIRGSDLLVIPNCHSDQTISIAFDMEENVTPDPVLCVQSALLYTNCEGERRIRVCTWAGVTTQNCNDIISTVDVQTTTTMLSHISLQHSLSTNLAEGRNKLQETCRQLVQASNMAPQVEALQFLPLYIMGMMKSAAFRATNDIYPDMRTYIWMRLETLNVSQLSAYYYPRMMALHNMPNSVALPDENGQCTLPDLLNLTSESMSQDGAYVIDDGESILMWIGREINPAFLQSVFGVAAFNQLEQAEGLDGMVGTRGDPLSNKVAAVLAQIRSERAVPYMQLKVIRCGDQFEPRFFASLIEDRTIGMQSTYTEFLQRMGFRSQSANTGPQPVPAPPQNTPGGIPQGALAPPSMRR